MRNSISSGLEFKIEQSVINHVAKSSMIIAFIKTA